MGIQEKIPGINTSASTNLPVLLRFHGRTVGHASDLTFSRWLSSPWAWMSLSLALLLLWPGMVLAQPKFTLIDAMAALWRWIPVILTQGFALNIIISFLTMAIGTITGFILGIWQISKFPPLRLFAFWMTQLFRNSPWLVLLFIVLLAFPFEIDLGFTKINFPDWLKAVFGLALPIMANLSEVVRGAVLSVPRGQWEAAESMSYTRRQTIWLIILPQCFKQMIPPWMNWYAILTMATPLVSLLGVEEMITLTRQAMGSEDNHPELLIPFYGFALIIFFVYCYPIARFTVKLEQRFAVKL